MSLANKILIVDLRLPFVDMDEEKRDFQLLATKDSFEDWLVDFLHDSPVQKVNF